MDRQGHEADQPGNGAPPAAKSAHEAEDPREDPAAQQAGRHGAIPAEQSRRDTPREGGDEQGGHRQQREGGGGIGDRVAAAESTVTESSPAAAEAAVGRNIPLKRPEKPPARS